ncbi:MAG: hypothetical protein ACON4Z_10325 [Planctomycetota bacterium]
MPASAPDLLLLITTGVLVARSGPLARALVRTIGALTVGARTVSARTPAGRAEA